MGFEKKEWKRDSPSPGEPAQTNIPLNLRSESRLTGPEIPVLAGSGQQQNFPDRF